MQNQVFCSSAFQASSDAVKGGCVDLETNMDYAVLGTLYGGCMDNCYWIDIVSGLFPKGPHSLDCLAP